MNKLNTGFSRVRDEDLDNRAQSIIAALTDNANFPTPAPSLATVTTALTEFQNALAMQPGAARNASVAASRTKLTGLLEQLARNLELTPGATDETLATTGYDMRQTPSRSSAAVAAPGNVRLKSTGITGQLQVLCDPVDRARSYQVQYSDNGNGTQWEDGGVYASTRGMLINGLSRGKDYWARVRAVGPDGAGPWSDPATAMAT